MIRPMDLIGEALAKGQSTLNEYDSKRFLSQFGIPVCREALASGFNSAANEAAKIGFPIVLKACGPHLTHKTEAGGVVLNLRSRREVQKEGQRLLKIEGCEALLVQEMVKGDREFVCGLERDSQFGPCVMFGLGGVLTEIFGDVSFRISPLTPLDAREMIQEIRSRKILEPFRGEPAVDLEVLSQTLVALGEIGLQYKEVSSVDINPLKIRPNGKPVSVDALVLLKGGGPND
ncbi:MAG: carboxylate--amine ligase [Deltaproteobacteria bacterium]|nr:carboxylate--amine ligase [Deltaproteobacteria bacterium]